MAIREMALTSLFTPSRGNSTYTRNYGKDNPGKYPVWSATQKIPLTYINHFDYDGKYLTWNTNGLGGFVSIVSGKFSVNGDRGILIPLAASKMDLRYFKYFLQPILREKAKGRRGDKGKNEFTKVSLAAIKEVFIPCPVLADGSLDLEEQKRIADRLERVDSIRNALFEKIKELSAVEVKITTDERAGSFKEFSLSDKKLFFLFIGKRVLKKDVFNSVKGIDLYSANVFTPFGLVKESNIKDFTSDYILWGIDGDFNFNLMKKGKAFATTDHCGALKILNNAIVPEYLLYQLSILVKTTAYDRSLRASLKNMYRLSVPFPVKKDGTLDEERQKKIAGSYMTISSSKRVLAEKMAEIKSIEVNIAG